MASKTKTKETEKSVVTFILDFADSEQKRNDAFELMEWMEKVTGYKPKMWGPSIIGFGSYHYKYASGHEGDAPMIGFSPRKAAISLYVTTGKEEHLPLLENLGKYKMAKACIYVKKLADINLDVLEKVVLTSMQYLREIYTENN